MPVEFYLIKGHAGSGKTALLRRLAWDASIEFNKLCISLKHTSFPEYDPLLELYRLCKERIFLFIDPVCDFLDPIEYIIHRAHKDKLPLTIIGAERNNEWNMNCEYLETHVTDTYEVKYLTEKEIDSLIPLLTRYDSLGHLKNLSLAQQREALSKRVGRQLLVALHEATLGRPFTDIVFDEYNSIPSIQAKSLYLTVCILHRLGIDTRAGLISRVHGIPFHFFKEHLFKPLEFVIFASKSEYINDYIYRSRHSHIAEIVFERVLKTQQDRYDEFLRIINSLDIDYNSDRQAFGKLSNGKELLALFNDPQMVRQLYAALKGRFGDIPILLQQEAIFEMNSAGESLDKASTLLEIAYTKAQFNKRIAHSLSELALRKAELAKSPLEKQKFRQESRKLSQELISKEHPSEYPYHTLIKIGLDELEEIIKEGDAAVLERKIKEIEQIIAIAKQLFPDSSFILDSEASFCKLINKFPLALQSLKKAFEMNKRSPYIALRLSKMYEFDGNLSKAVEVLKECVDSNPSDKDVNFRLAYLLGRIPDSNPAEIKHHYRRSFTKGDGNYNAQFYYARLIYLDGVFGEANDIFKFLSSVNIDSRIKKEPRAVVMGDGGPARFSGTVTKKESSYGFIIRDGFSDRVFMHYDYVDDTEWQRLSFQSRVSFEMAFNYSGPIALKIQSGPI